MIIHYQIILPGLGGKKPGIGLAEMTTSRVAAVIDNIQCLLHSLSVADAAVVDRTSEICI